MFQRTVSREDLDRLRQEREAADRAYNDALTRLDEAIRPLREPPRRRGPSRGRSRQRPGPAARYRTRLRTSPSGNAGWAA